MASSFTAEFKLLFFDSPAVVARMKKARRRALSKAGAFVRRRAQTSIRPRKKSSPPGQPPSSHAGLLRKFIYFAWDQSSESVVVGPVPLDTRPQSPGAPELLEHGGSVSRELKSGRKVRDTYAGNPFMSPSLEKERPKFAALFKGLLGG